MTTLPENYIEFDEYSDALYSLRHAAFFCAETARDRTMWKWAIIALHNALQGAMICHLSGTAGLGALEKDSIKAALDWHEGDRMGQSQPYPKEKVAPANVLFKRLSGQASTHEGAGGPIKTSKQEVSSFERLHALRNDFSHFTPKSWIIETSGLAQIFGGISQILLRILDAGFAFRHADPALIEEARSCLARFVAEAKT